MGVVTNLHIARYGLIILLGSAFLLPVQAEQNTLSDPNIQVVFNYPNIVEPGKSFVLSSVVKALADQVSNVTLTISSPELQIAKDTFHINKIAKDSTLGNNFNAIVNQDTPDGSFVVNVEGSYYIKGFFDSQPVEHSLTQTIELNAQSIPILSLELQSPDNVFAGEPFSIEGSIKNTGTSAHNIKLDASSSQLQLTGKKSILVTDLDAGEIQSFEFSLQTQKDITEPIHATIHINGTYLDSKGNSHALDSSVDVFARHRGILEIGDANGIWIGKFFIAPVVGIGTIVSSLIGFLIFVWHYRNKKKKKKSRKAS